MQPVIDFFRQLGNAVIPYVNPIKRLLQSSKFVLLLAGVLYTHWGVDLDANTQALIVMVAVALWSGTTAIEDAAKKRAGG